MAWSINELASISCPKLRFDHCKHIFPSIGSIIPKDSSCLLVFYCPCLLQYSSVMCYMESNSSHLKFLEIATLLFKFLNTQKSIKPEKEGEEKVKKPRFHNILNPPRRLSRVDSTSGEDFLSLVCSSSKYAAVQLSWGSGMHLS